MSDGRTGARTGLWGGTVGRIWGGKGCEAKRRRGGRGRIGGIDAKRRLCGGRGLKGDRL